MPEPTDFLGVISDRSPHVALRASQDKPITDN